MELYYEPRKNVENRMEFYPGEPEMNEYESAFLCGVIKTYQPRKIVEIGVAAGGTTAIVMECIHMLGMQDVTSMTSVDILENFYVDPRKRVGFLGNVEKEKLLEEGVGINHSFLLGDIVPAFWEQIDDEVDMVILDTAHSLPGEVLDFLSIFPKLRPGSVVVLHDITLNAIKSDCFSCFASKLLLDVIEAEKIYGRQEKQEIKLANIAAFIINDETRKSLFDVISMLTVSWHYMPSEKNLADYRKIIEKYYSDKELEMFDTVLCIQKRINDNKNKKLSLKRRIRTALRVIIKGV